MPSHEPSSGEATRTPVSPWLMKVRVSVGERSPSHTFSAIARRSSTPCCRVAAAPAAAGRGSFAAATAGPASSPAAIPSVVSRLRSGVIRAPP